MSNPLPTSIRIGYRDYRVEIFSPEIAEAKARFGEIDHEAAVLRLQGNIDAPKMANTMLHELLHGCWYVGGLDRDSRKREERIIRLLANQLAQVWRDNPQLVDWITQQMRGFDNEKG